MAKPRSLGSMNNIEGYLKEGFIYILESLVLPISSKNFSKLDRNEKIKGDRRNPLNRRCCTRKITKSECHHCELVLNLPACKYEFHSERKLIQHLISQEAIIKIHVVLSEAELNVLYPSSADQRKTRQSQTVTVLPSHTIIKETVANKPFCEQNQKSASSKQVTGFPCIM